MHPIGLLFALFIAVPLVEIYVLIQVGSVIGAGWTILAVVGTALLGAVLVRAQGLATLMRARGQMTAGEVPAVEILEGVALIAAGALLMTPGFVTDTLGFCCLVPSWRQGMARALLRRVVVVGRPGASAPDRNDGRSGERSRVIEGEYRRRDE